MTRPICPTCAVNPLLCTGAGSAELRARREAELGAPYEDWVHGGSGLSQIFAPIAPYLGEGRGSAEKSAESGLPGRMSDPPPPGPGPPCGAGMHRFGPRGGRCLCGWAVLDISEDDRSATLTLGVAQEGAR